ncbi:MAG: YraN family protein [Candidatus Margulisbacteria bacterium]|nr:YraN family protein [Candidatus Margulisiibacteriota bacterium]
MIELNSEILFLILIVFLLGLILGIILLWQLRKWWFRRKIQNQHYNAKLGETAAEQLLIKHGYQIIERQARFPLKLLFDGEPWETDILADLIVKKDDQIYVAEVKTGLNAPKIKTATTRRQLLEYYITYKPDGVLLVDMSANQIHTIEFLF